MLNDVFTETEARIVALLSDGEEHSREEIHQLLPDSEFRALSNIRAHISNIRKKLPAGEMIVCVINRFNRKVYRYVAPIRRARMITDE